MNAAIGFIPFNQAGMFKPTTGIAVSAANLVGVRVAVTAADHATLGCTK